MANTTQGRWQAFPGGEEQAEGLTGRDYFAAVALNGLLAGRPAGTYSEPAAAAKKAAEYADALLAVLYPPPKTPATEGPADGST